MSNEVSEGVAVTSHEPVPDPSEAGSAQVIGASIVASDSRSTDPSRGTKVRPGDRVFGGLATGSGVLIVVLIAAIGLFLLWRAIPALTRNQENFFLYGGNWITTDTSAMHFGVFELFQVTVFVSLFALALAMPVALGIAIFLTQYAPRRLAGPLGYMVDLLAAVPSIIFGVWGLYVLAPVIRETLENARKAGRQLHVIATVCGTRQDPQNYDQSVAVLKAAGALVEESNARAVRLALQLKGVTYTEADKQVVKREFKKVALPRPSNPLMELLTTKPRVINIGLESFNESILKFGGKSVQYTWRPVAGGNKKLIRIGA